MILQTLSSVFPIPYRKLLNRLRNYESASQRPYSSLSATSRLPGLETVNDRCSCRGSVSKLHTHLLSEQGTLSAGGACIASLLHPKYGCNLPKGELFLSFNGQVTGLFLESTGSVEPPLQSTDNAWLAVSLATVVIQNFNCSLGYIQFCAICCKPNRLGSQLVVYVSAWL